MKVCLKMNPTKLNANWQGGKIMEIQQKFLKIRKIFNDVIEEEVRKYLSESQSSKVTFFNIFRGNMFFLDKYELIGDEDGDNEVLSQIYGRNFLNEAPTFIIPDDSSEGCTFLLYLERSDYKNNDRSYFIKESHKGARVYRLDREAMLENEEFKKCILQMFKDIVPNRTKEVIELIS